jgi:tRNA(fMet)-specific endonuclease VapC
MNYLVDTNILIDHLRIGESKATKFLKKVEEGQLRASISVITEYELLVSSKISPVQRKLIEQLLKFLPSISVTSSTVQEAIKLSQNYQLGMADSIIAATALQTNATLVTRDTSFSKIQELQVDKLK